jgi:hypothetical protein
MAIAAPTGHPYTATPSGRSRHPHPSPPTVGSRHHHPAPRAVFHRYPADPTAIYDGDAVSACPSARGCDTSVDPLAEQHHRTRRAGRGIGIATPAANAPGRSSSRAVHAADGPSSAHGLLREVPGPGFFAAQGWHGSGRAQGLVRGSAALRYSQAYGRPLPSPLRCRARPSLGTHPDTGGHHEHHQPHRPHDRRPRASLHPRRHPGVRLAPRGQHPAPGRQGPAGDVRRRHQLRGPGRGHRRPRPQGPAARHQRAPRLPPVAGRRRLLPLPSTR